MLYPRYHASLELRTCGKCGHVDPLPVPAAG